ncbi:polysaccharide deacetylase family protein [Polaribacter undariae]|uniref:Polysaccharide deacetylase family protein n=2 Tax=Polaribacter sejongensis TaxID=985043 RepID=A0AAJ1VF14_9FLAO|nr:polysaccharide deacetylase family protein [Polaribacter undariae]MDN3618523.1 polysaccharide deacetylase family protein [Polaribacter undariae]UWD30496.1 polysaccharide deacetylase family protein [Polaribacter undariae]
MKSYFPRTPRFMMRFFSTYTWRFLSDKKEIFLTFDDGPTPEITEFVLTELKKYNAKATFFCIGKNIQNHPEIFSKLITDGHSIGNHTQNHLKGWKSETNAYLKNALECEQTITQFNTSTITQKLFRPPYGKIKKNQAKQLIEKGYKIIMWSVLSADFDTTISNEKCLENVLKNTEPGSIIVFHDSVKAAERMKYALPKVLKHFSDKGFVFKAI